MAFLIRVLRLILSGEIYLGPSATATPPERFLTYTVMLGLCRKCVGISVIHRHTKFRMSILSD
jgi:hypothetical protein